MSHILVPFMYMFFLEYYKYYRNLSYLCNRNEGIKLFFFITIYITHGSFENTTYKEH